MNLDGIPRQAFHAPALTTIRLGGALGAEFGREFRISVATVVEAVRALTALRPRFYPELASAEKRGLAYVIRLDGRRVNEQDLQSLDITGRVLRITPVLQGAKNGGLFQVILGAALITASFYTGGLAGALGAGAASTLGTATFSMGFSMALGGVVQMLSPQQRGLGTRDSVENGASYVFNGPVNTTRQGDCVPVLYGRLMVGSAVASAGIYAEDQA